VAAVFGLYTAGWFWLASRIESGTRTVLDSLVDRGIKAECANPKARGFPFRIGLYCDSVAFDQPGENVSVTAGAFRSAGQIYDPSRLVAELDGPAEISVPGAGVVSLDWSVLRASTRLAQPLPKRVSLEGKALKVTPAGGAELASAETFEGHMRPNGADLDLAARFAGLTLASDVVAGRSIPPLSGEADLSVTDGVRLLGEGQNGLRGTAATVRNLTLRLGGQGSLTVSGPIAVDADGLVDATLQVSLEDPRALAASLAQIFPEAGREIDRGFAGLSLLGNRPTLPLRITKSEASLGFIRLGRLPPLD
jgi:hypothetical protein